MTACCVKILVLQAQKGASTRQAGLTSTGCLPRPSHTPGMSHASWPASPAEGRVLSELSRSYSSQKHCECQAGCEASISEGSRQGGEGNQTICIWNVLLLEKKSRKQPSPLKQTTDQQEMCLTACPGECTFCSSSTTADTECSHGLSTASPWSWAHATEQPFWTCAAAEAAALPQSGVLPPRPALQCALAQTNPPATCCRSPLLSQGPVPQSAPPRQLLPAARLC